MSLLRVLQKSSLLFKFKELSNVFAVTIAVHAEPNSGLSSGLILKDSKGLTKTGYERVHL
jgi:hypothetical protein